MEKVRENIMCLIDNFNWVVINRISSEYDYIHEMLQTLDTIISPFLPQIYDVFYASECNDRLLLKYHQLENKMLSYIKDCEMEVVIS